MANTHHQQVGMFMNEEAAEFVSPFLRADNNEEIVVVQPKDPSKKKVYVICEEAGLTGRNYVYCSSCHHRAFKLFRNVTRRFVPDHLKRYGNSDTELLKFCRTCWYGVESPSKLKKERDVRRPHFERGPLGITDQRACFGWHFIQRDFVRRKFTRNDVPPLHSQNTTDENKNVADHGQKVTSLVTVVHQEGSEFVSKDHKGSHFNFNGKEISLHGNESGYLSNCDSPSNEGACSILLNIQKDHDYAPAMQREVEITTSANSPDRRYMLARQKPTKIQQGKNLKTDKFDNGKQQTANKLLKKAVLFDGGQKIDGSKLSNNFLKISTPSEKVEEQLISKLDWSKAPDPSMLVGLKATAEDGQVIPGLICPLCGEHTVKSYSVWKKGNAPHKIMHLFKDGVTVIRACRKCVPYPINREREKKLKNDQSSSVKKFKQDNNFNSKSVVTVPPGKTNQAILKMDKSKVTQKTNNTVVNVKKMKDGNIVLNVSVNGVSKGSTNGVSFGKNRGSKDAASLVKQVAVKVTNINACAVKGDEQCLKKRKKLRSDVDDVIDKRARIEEKKRKIENESGGALTGLECFESIEDRAIAGRKKIENSLTCDEDGAFEDEESGKSNAEPARSSKIKLCDKCSATLGKTFKTVKMSKCPKRYTYFFKENRNRRSMKLCARCTT